MNNLVKQLDTSNDRELNRAFAVFAYLRPHLDLAAFLQRVRLQRAEGYKIVYLERDMEIASVAGYRVASFLAWGKVLYIDDLITHPEKKRLGLGGALLQWLIEEGRKLGCDEVHLDTGFTRHDAHRLYLNTGFKLTCHHLSLQLAKENA
jgi:GNAT superfamily N-acetyltransferase